MSQSRQATLVETAGGASKQAETEEQRLRRLYDQHDGVVARVAADCDLSRERVRSRLVEYGIHEKPELLEHRLLDLYPQDLGLSPLGCAKCGEPEIVAHPCEECGFDPTQGEYSLSNGGGA